MPFSIPDGLDGFSREGLADLSRLATSELTTIRASVADPEQVSDDELSRMEELAAFVASVDTEAKRRADKAARFAGTEVAVVEDEKPVVASVDNPVKDAAPTVVTGETGGTLTTVVAATVTHSSAVEAAPMRSVQVADVAPLAPAPVVADGEEKKDFVIRASSDVPGYAMGAELTLADLGKAFASRTSGYSNNKAIMASGGFAQHGVAQIERQFPEHLIIDAGTDLGAYQQLANVTAEFNRGEANTAGIGWCAPSPVDYSTCNPIQALGLFQAPEVAAPRGGVRHNQGLAFTNFFNEDLTLPIPGYNILTEAQVIADTAKTCYTIPCPTFVDDRLNVAALCLTGNLLQNRAYPEFVSEFVSGAMAAMAHLVNREILAEIVTGSTAVNVSSVDPWGSDGSVVSQIMSLVEFAAIDLRYFYRTAPTQTVSFVFPLWVKGAMRADWIRRNGFRNDDDLLDQMIDRMFAARNVSVQFVMDFQDGFAPTNGAGAIIAGQQLGATGQAVTNRPWTYPTSVSFLAFLPGTWVIARNPVIRLDSVYDSTKLATNQVTQLFLEDGYKSMRMCPESRYYTVPICANGSTGVQRAVTCTDVTPA